MVLLTGLTGLTLPNSATLFCSFYDKEVLVSAMWGNHEFPNGGLTFRKVDGLNIREWEEVFCGKDTAVGLAKTLLLLQRTHPLQQPRQNP